MKNENSKIRPSKKGLIKTGSMVFQMTAASPPAVVLTGLSGLYFMLFCAFHMLKLIQKSAH
jgi:hypothetical protein